MTDSASDESFKIALSSDAIRDLQLSEVDIALVKGKRGKETALLVQEDNDVKDGSAKINEVARCNLQVEPGDDILVYPFPQIKCVRFPCLFLIFMAENFNFSSFLYKNRPSVSPLFQSLKMMRILPVHCSINFLLRISKRRTHRYMMAIFSLLTAESTR